MKDRNTKRQNAGQNAAIEDMQEVIDQCNDYDKERKTNKVCSIDGANTDNSLETVEDEVEMHEEIKVKDAEIDYLASQNELLIRRLVEV